MPDQQVPWALGRRALVRLPGAEWRDAAGWEDFDHHDAYARMWGIHFALSAETALLPDQCPRCFEVSTHAPGCMVAANLARGVPVFWAPWAMWMMPRRLPVGFSLIVIHEACSPRRVTEFADWNHSEGAENGGSAVVCLGFDGPTLEPWSKP